MNAWLMSLSPGDNVIVIDGPHDYSSKVIRATTTMIVLNRDQRYRRSDGREVGGSGGFRPRQLIEPTTERMNGIKHRELVKTLELHRWSNHSLETLEKVLAIIT